jgi:hypothetical protein
MTKHCALAVAGVLFALSKTGAEPPAVKVALEDQFERKQDVAQLRGNVVVVTYGDMDGAAANKALGDKLHLYYHPTAKGLSTGQASKAPAMPVPQLKEGSRSPDVRIVAVACVGKVLEPVKNYMRLRYKKESPDSTVLLDFEDKMLDEYSMKEGETNLLVVDAAGRIRLKVNGQLDPASYNKVLHVIDFLRKEAADGK